MELELDGYGVALSALLLSVNLLATLKAKGIFSEGEAREIVDLGLLNLEEQEQLARPQRQSAVRSARVILKDIRDRL